MMDEASFLVTIHLHICHDKVLVWDPKEALFLRRDCRIVGRCVGCFPLKPRQNAHLGLPLQLSLFEAKIVAELYRGQFVSSYFPDVHDEKRTEEYHSKHRKAQHKIQIHLKRNDELDFTRKTSSSAVEIDHKQTINEYVGAIETSLKDNQELELHKVAVPGEITDVSASGTSQSHFQPESKTLAKQSVVCKDTESSMLQNTVRTNEPNYEKTWVKINQKSDYVKLSPSSLTDSLFTNMNNFHYQVFKDLHIRGYYLTDGTQFGGHFLAYPGDPGIYHSLYIVLCISDQQTLCSADYAALGRLATSVKKTLLTCSLDEHGQVVYNSMAWSGII